MYQEVAKKRVMKKYDELYACLTDLVKALEVIEPGGTLVDDVVLEKYYERVKLTYVAVPIQLVIDQKERRFILRVIDKG